MSTSFWVNGVQQTVDVDPSKPLLWVIREQLGLTGTKFGCGISQCGACTVHIDGAATRSCVTPISDIEGKQVTTIEGLRSASGELHPLQQAWVDHQVPQCGYCPGSSPAAAATSGTACSASCSTSAPSGTFTSTSCSVCSTNCHYIID